MRYMLVRFAEGAKVELHQQNILESIVALDDWALAQFFVVSRTHLPSTARTVERNPLMKNFFWTDPKTPSIFDKLRTVGVANVKQIFIKCSLQMAMFYYISPGTRFWFLYAL